ncbi:MAG: glucose-6-phosphate dehydrogenase assembly protein OpcA [bacterium]|nr:glucose-6-phosphate dehydrogenase assembly protein OpcA [bacterium]MDI1335580.1 glucose-6-phosphate dehydrogenase assembly protein OpcA [Lacunisphaera sp.]
MPAVFDTLPGQEVPVGGINAGFNQLWADTPAKDSRAVQLNLVLHLGGNTTPPDALVQFDYTRLFAQRYPCRVVVLCPDHAPQAPAEIRAKIYGECFLGKSSGDMRCVEFVLLHYTLAARRHLENQVSVCLSTDMPLYYWAHRFADVQKLADYHYLLTRSTRILFDSAVVPADAFTYPWPNLAAVRDLAYTRTLPLRQNLGQFLSRYSPALINAGLQQVTIRHRAQFAAEASCLLGWVKKGLVRSGADTGTIKFEVTPVDCPGCFSMRFTYADPKKVFSWEADLSQDHADFTGDLGMGRTTLEVGAHFLAAEQALSEAMFF